METYYVVERNNKYANTLFEYYGDKEMYGSRLGTTKSLLDCKRYETQEEAQDFADKYNCTVRKVIVQIED